MRFLQYLPGLDEYDIDVHPAPFLDDVYLKELYGGRRPSMNRVFSFYSERLRHLVKARDFDAVWIEKEVLPWVPHWVDMTALGSLPLVVDFDDAWHLRYSGSSNPLVRGMLGKKLERIARRADFVIVANKFLQSWAESTGAKRVNCIPTVVDLRRYPQTAPPPSEPFTIGWIGTPETAPYLETIKGALARCSPRRTPGCWSSAPSKSFLPLANVEIRAMVGEERDEPAPPHACRHHAAAARRLGVRQVRLQARAIHGCEPAGGRLPDRRQLRRGAGRRERLLRHYRG